MAEGFDRGGSLRQLQARLGRGQLDFAEILDSLAEAVTIRDPSNHIVFANRAAVQSMGFSSLEELQARPAGVIFADYVVEDENGEEVTMDDIPSVKLLAGEPILSLTLRITERASGEVKWVVLKSSALRDETGELVAAATIIEDITKEKLAELRDRFLSAATATLMSSLDYEETLRHVAWLAVPQIADWCAVDLVDESSTRQHVAVAHRDPDKLTLAAELRRFEPEHPDPEVGLGRVLRTGVAELFRDVPDELLVGAAKDDRHLALLRAVGFRSVLLVPLRARGRTLGAMTLVSAESLRSFDQGDLQFAEQLAARAAIAVDNARLATERQQIARTLQQSLLPEGVPPIEGWSIATMYEPGGAAAEVQVGGDFYDFFATNQGWLVLLGDVTGKGVAAAAMTSLMRHGARFLSRQELEPSQIFAELDAALRDQSALSLCTAVFVRLHDDHFVVSTAGHPAPLIVREDGRIREIDMSGSILGAWRESTWTDCRVPIASDEQLFIYTDGVTDTQGAGERFGIGRLRRLLTEHARDSPADLLAALEAELARFGVEGQSDDKAALAFKPLR